MWARFASVLVALWAVPTQAAVLHAVAHAPLEPGDQRCIADNNVNLRAAPNTQSAVQAQLILGTAVKVRAVVPGGPAEVSGRLDWWYEVVVIDDNDEATAKGYLYGPTLTPACFEADLNGDGQSERITATMNLDGATTVHIQATDMTHRVAVPFSRARGVRPVGVTWMGPHEAGFAMLRVQTGGRGLDEQVDGDVAYIAWPAGRAPAVVLTHGATGLSTKGPIAVLPLFSASAGTVEVRRSLNGAPPTVQRYRWDRDRYVPVPQ